MYSSNRSGYAPVTNIDRMMDRLGIEVGYGAVPRFGLAFSSVRRTCIACTAPEACAKWLAENPNARFGPPKFCPNVDILWELLCDPAIGLCAQSVH